LLGKSIFLHPIFISAFAAEVACCAVIRQAQKPGAFIIFGSLFFYYCYCVAFSAAFLLLIHL